MTPTHAAPALAGQDTGAAPTLRLNPLLELHWRDWGEDSVALEACSGRVFLFDPLSAALLACFESGAQPLQQACDSLMADLADPAARGDADPQSTCSIGGALQAAGQRFLHMGWLLPAGA